jgi:hypothetical protein
MARYLVYTSPARGRLYPVVPTLEEFQQRGHEVVVRTLASEVGLHDGLFTLSTWRGRIIRGG